MKKLLLAALLSASAIIIAHAVPAQLPADPAQLPAEMLGPWCPDPKEMDDHGTVTYVRASNEQVDKDVNCMTVTPTDFHNIEGVCKFTNIKQSKTPDVYIVDMRCSEGEDIDPEGSTSAFTLVEGKLVIKEVN